jgi:aminobenzoyl-glutamate utilization protein B
VPQETRIHYVITDGGKAPNVVPDFAEVFYYVRHPDANTVLDIWERLQAAALGAAQGTGTSVESEIIHGSHSILVNETLQKLMDEKLRAVGGVTYNAEERQFAEKIHATFVDPELALGSQAQVQPYRIDLGYASTDVGDVSMVVPTVGASVATWVPGTSAHSWQAVAASGTSIGFKGAQVASKSLALAAIELYQNEELRRAARAEFEERRGENFQYIPLLGDRPPPLDYRK